MAAKVFIVDDHLMVIEGIRSILQQEKDIDWIGHATTAASCLSFLTTRQPDIILMDIHLPDMNGIDLCKEVREKYPGIFVIGLSTFNQHSFIQKMIDQGASGYVLKNATRQELMDAFGTVMRGGRYFSTEAAQLLKKPVSEGAPVLTRRELEILSLIAEGMTNQEIADKLFVSSTTVNTHRKNLLAKFKAKNTATLIRMAVQLRVI